MKWKMIRKWLIILLAIYLTGALALYFLQDDILFHPVQLKRTHNYDFPVPHEDISIPINAEDTLNLVRFYSTDTIKRGAVLYFHGNKENISRYAQFSPYFTKHGYELFMIDYPGFGKSTGKFTEKILYAWAGLVYKFVNSRFSADSIIIYGKSMGTGIAANLASSNACKRLMLETPYFDFPSIVKHYLPIYPVGRLLNYQLPTHRYLPMVKAPISIFHGTDDDVIAYENSRQLQPVLKSTDEFITIEHGNHNDLYSFHQTVAKLDSLLRL